MEWTFEPLFLYFFVWILEYEFECNETVEDKTLIVEMYVGANENPLGVVILF
jgi:hypothetical protein